MVTILQMLRRWELNDLEAVTADAMELNSEQLTDLNREQMNDGLLSTGGFIRPPYTAMTRKQKQIKGQPSGVVTLKDTGEFQSKMYLTIRGANFTFNSADYKTAGLIDKYSERIFGLSPDNKGKAWGVLRSDVVKILARKTGTLYE